MKSPEERLSSISSSLDTADTVIKYSERLFAQVFQQFDRAIKSLEQAVDFGTIKLETLEGDQSPFLGLSIHVSNIPYWSHLFWLPDEHAWILGYKDCQNKHRGGTVVYLNERFNLTNQMCKVNQANLHDVISIVENVVQYLRNNTTPESVTQSSERIEAIKAAL